MNLPALRGKVAKMLLEEVIEDRLPAQLVPATVEFTKEFRALPRTRARLQLMREVMVKIGGFRYVVSHSLEPDTEPIKPEPITARKPGPPMILPAAARATLMM